MNISPMVSPFSSELHFHILFSFLLKAPKRSVYCLGLLHRDIQTAQTHMLCHCKMNTPSWRSKAKNAEIITLGTWYHPPIKQECNENFSDKCSIATLDFLAEFHVSHICSHKKNKSHVHHVPRMTPALTCSSPNVVHKSRASPAGRPARVWLWRLWNCGPTQKSVGENRLEYPNLFGIFQLIHPSIFNRVDKFSTKKCQHLGYSNRFLGQHLGYCRWNPPVAVDLGVSAAPHLLPTDPQTPRRACQPRQGSAAVRKVYSKIDLAKWNNISPTWIFLKGDGISLPKSYLLKCEVVWGRYNLTRLMAFLLNHIVVVRFNPVITESNHISGFVCLNRRLSYSQFPFLLFGDCEAWNRLGDTNTYFRILQVSQS